MTTIPTLSETLNTEFTQTWYEIRPEAIDNILDATPVLAAMRDLGVYTEQIGGRKIERTIRYGEKTSFNFGKGDVLPVTEGELKMPAFWTWAYKGVPVTRTFEDDQQNSGQFQITDYVQDRLTAAYDSLVQALELIFMAEAIHDGGKAPLSLFDYVPDTSVTGTGVDYFSSSSYTYGGIARSNLFWEHMDFTAVAAASTANQLGIKSGPASLTMIEDMKNAYNYAGKQLSYPDIIITTQTLFEIYESFAEAKEQIVKDTATRLADLGFEVLRYKGKPLVWSENMSASQMLMLNTSFIDLVFDPRFWFDMTTWERPPRQLEQVAYIIMVLQLVGFNPRFNARLKWTAVS